MATALAVCLAAALSVRGGNDDSFHYAKVTGLPGYNETDSSYSGYINVPSYKNASIFFWFYEARNKAIPAKDIPVVLWLQGGPGSSGSMGNFFQLGPYRANQQADGQIVMAQRDGTWVDDFHVLFVDQPIGTGLSYITGKDVWTNFTVARAAQHMREVLGVFFSDAMFPQYRANALYLAGEAYAAKWVPYFADYFLTQPGPKLNVKGIAVGDGWNNPCFQSPYMIDTAVELGFLTEKQAESMRTNLLPGVLAACAKKDWMGALVAFRPIVKELIESGAGIDPYDSRRHEMRPHDYDYHPITDFLNDPSIRRKLSADTAASADWSFVMNRSEIDTAMNPQNFLDSTPFYLSTLDTHNLRVLFYHGQNDYLWSVRSQLRWLDQLGWHGQAAWESSAQSPIYHRDATGTEYGPAAGFARSAKNLQFVNVFNAGHSAAMDQPLLCQQVLKNWIAGKPI